MNWLQKIAQSVSINLGEEYPKQLREFMYELSDSSQQGEYPFTREEAEAEITRIFAETKNNMNKVLQLVQQAVSSIQWNGSSVVVNVAQPPSEISFGSDYLKPVEDAYISVGKQSAWGGIADFTLFMEGGKIAEIDDVLEAGDDDFFSDPKIQQDYFNLVRELKHPGSGGVSRVVTLYTARPIEDRALFEGAESIPSNLFMTTSYDRAEGIGRDLGGSSGSRDIWKVRVEQKYLLETLNMGYLRDYQVIGEGVVPVKSIQLITPGEPR